MTGVLIGPDDAGNLAFQMNEILTDESKRTEMIMRGLQRIKLFSWEDAAKKTMETYQKLVP